MNTTKLPRQALRTPEERFRDLPDYPFSPHWIEVGGLRMHYVDEGPSDAPPILMLHGEPSWSYLYRHMIPPCSERYRVVAPDLIGFGKSDKPAKVAAYSYQTHMVWLEEFVTALDLDRITLVCQDWGSLLGLRLAAERPELFDRITVGNGFLATGERKPPLAFAVWKTFALRSPWFPIARIVNAGSFKTLSAGERRAYDAPFPSARYKAGARAFPRLVPVSPADPAAPACRAAWEALGQWEKPFLTAFSNGDPIMRGGDRVLRSHVPGAAGQPHTTLKGGHFLQEDSGPEWAELLLDWLDDG